MKQQLEAFKAEILKNKRSKIIWVTFLAFALAPIFGGVFMLLMQGDGLSGAFKLKAEAMNFEANWDSFLTLLSQAVGIGGVIIFGFVASWLFGREYSEGTVKDILSLPVSRTKILNAKFYYYFIWCIALVISNLLLGFVIGFVLNIPGWSFSVFAANIKIYFFTTFLVMMLNIPVAFFAIVGKGYLVPLGLVVITLVLAQIIGALGFGIYFPWSVPGIYSGGGGENLRSQLNLLSYLIVFLTGVIGYFATILWWKFSDQGN